jgi:uncharacterized membrane protein YbhN (UPF0104 family)
LFGWMLYSVAQHAQFVTLDRAAVQPAYALLSLGLLFASYAAFIAAWRQLAEHAGLHASWELHAARWSVSILGKYVPGKVWQAVSRLALYAESKRWHSGALAIAIELLVQVAACAVLAGLLLPLALPATPGWMPIALGLLGLLPLAALRARPVHDLLERVLARFGIRIGWKRIPARLLRVVVGWDALAYIAMVAGYVMFVEAIGYAAASIAPALAAGLLLGGIAGMAAFIVPAGLGVREAALAWVLSATVSPPDAMFLAVVSRVWLTLGEVMIVAPAGALLWYRQSAPRGTR